MKKILFLALQFLTFALLAQQQPTKAQKKQINASLAKANKVKSISYDFVHTMPFFDSDKKCISQGKVLIKHRKDEDKGNKFIVHFTEGIMPITFYVDEMQLLINNQLKTILQDSIKKDEEGDIDYLNTMANVMLFSFYNGKIEDIETIFMPQEDIESNYIDSANVLKITEKYIDNTSQTEYIIDKKTKNFIQFNVVDITQEDTILHTLELKNIVFNKVKDSDFELLLPKDLQEYTIKNNWEHMPLPLLSINTPAPNITGHFFPHYENEAIALQYNKVTILDFWFAGCIPCMKTVPLLNELKTKYKDKLDIIGINPFDVDISAKEIIEKFLTKSKAEFPFFLAKDANRAFHVSYYPTIYVVDENGKIIFVPEAHANNRKELLDTFLEEYFSKF